MRTSERIAAYVEIIDAEHRNVQARMGPSIALRRPLRLRNQILQRVRAESKNQYGYDPGDPI